LLAYGDDQLVLAQLVGGVHELNKPEAVVEVQIVSPAAAET
jgi:hypothetical protein